MSKRRIDIEPSTGSQQEYFFEPEVWFDVQHPADEVTSIREPNHSEDVLSYVLHGSKRSILIDTGMGLSNISQSLGNSEIPQMVLLTHTHWDHMGSVSAFPDVRVPDQPFEKSRLRKGWQPIEMVGFENEEFINPLLPPPPQFSKDTFALPGLDTYTTLKDGQIFDLGDLHVQVIFTPGHSPGSACFFVPETGYLFTGDTIYPGPIYLHMQESNPDQYIQSMEKLMSSIGREVTQIFPGHNNFSAPPTLLVEHYLAAKGLLEPSEIIEDTDVFGPYTKKKFNGFSLLLPREWLLQQFQTLQPSCI